MMLEGEKQLPSNGQTGMINFIARVKELFGETSSASSGIRKVVPIEPAAFKPRHHARWFRSRVPKDKPMDRVLIVDDDPILLKMLTRKLGKFRERFLVVPATDGREAIAILNDQAISVLVTDIQMPHVDGLALLAHVSQHFPHMPCFVMTAYDSPELQKQLPQDLIRFYRKPFHVDDFARDLLKALNLSYEALAQGRISLHYLLRIAEMEQVTCTFEIRSAGGPAGVMHFHHGILLDASCKDKRGEDAAIELLRLSNTAFKVSFCSEEIATRRINRDLGAILQRAAAPAAWPASRYR